MSNEELGRDGTPSRRHEEPVGEGLPSVVTRWRTAARLAGDAPPDPSPLPRSLAAPPHLRAARAWRPGALVPSGRSANAAVTAGYQALDRAFAGYLDQPPLAVWVTFAKYSSREVGGWIRLLEDAMVLAHAVQRGRIVPGIRAGTGLVSGLGTVLRRSGPLCAARSGLGYARAGGRRPLGSAAAVRDALVEANTDIFSRIGTAFHAFLAGEAGGGGSGGGREAIAELARTGAVEDPMGSLARAFAHYHEARALGVEARSARARDRDVLLAIRRRLVAEANWLIAVQEQAILQRATVFDHPVLRAACRSTSPGELGLSLSASDPCAPSERFILLPQGGSWADYATRMGLVEVGRRGAPDAVVVRFPEREEPRVYAPDPRRPGTILDLFSRYLDGPAGSRLLRGAPRP